VETGPEGKVSGSWTICDVRDVAAAHIKAAEDPEASGRYIITNRAPIDGRFISNVIKGEWRAAAAGGALPDGEEEEVKDVISNDKVRGGVQSSPTCVGLCPSPDLCVDALREPPFGRDSKFSVSDRPRTDQVNPN
jgi:hypothetical protein